MRRIKMLALGVSLFLFALLFDKEMKKMNNLDKPRGLPTWLWVTVAVAYFLLILLVGVTQ